MHTHTSIAVYMYLHCIYCIYTSTCVFVSVCMYIFINSTVSDPRKGVCADPVNGGAVLGKGGLDPHSRDRERQLAPDKGRGKT